MPDITVTEAPPPGPPDTMLGATPAETFQNVIRGHALEKGEAGNETETKLAERAPDTEKKEETKSSVPESLLKPKEAKVDLKKPEFTPEEIHAALNERPSGQIKKDDFARAQAASRFRIAQVEAELDIIRTERDAYKSTAGKLTPEADKELTEIREQLAQARATLEQEAYQRTPEFHERFTAEEQNIRSLAETVLKTAGVDTAILDSVIHGVGRNRFNPLTEAELNEHEVDYIRGLVKDYDKLQPAKKAALEGAHERMTRVQQEQQRTAEAKRQSEVAEEAHLFESVHKEMLEQHGLFRHMEGDDAVTKKWNADQDAAKARLIKFLNGNNGATEAERLKQYFEVSHKGFAYDDLKREKDAWREKSESQAEELARLKAASPSVQGANGQRASSLEHDFSGRSTWAELVEGR